MRGLAGAHVHCLASDAEGRLWVGTDAEVAVFDGDRFRTMTPVNGESRIDVSLLFFTRDGGQWVVANGRARKARGRQWVWTERGGQGPDRPVPAVVERRRGSARRRLAVGSSARACSTCGAMAPPAGSGSPTGCPAIASVTCSRIARETSGWPSTAAAWCGCAIRGSRCSRRPRVCARRRPRRSPKIGTARSGWDRSAEVCSATATASSRACRFPATRPADSSSRSFPRRTAGCG